MTPVGTQTDISQLAHGSHACLFYHSQKEHLDATRRFVLDGLRKNEKVYCVTDALERETLLGAVQRRGLDARACLEQGRLTILPSREVYLMGGTFDPEAILARLADAADRAIKEGYAGLRGVSEMAWMLSDAPNCGRAVDYEAKANEVLQGRKCTALCLYDRRAFDPEFLLAVLAVHPWTVIGRHAYRNLYYIPPENYFSSELPKTELEYRLQMLRRLAGSGGADTAADTALAKERKVIGTVIRHIEYERKSVENRIVANVEEVLLPLLAKLKVDGAKDRRRYVDLLEQNLRELTSPFGERISRANQKLTRREIEIANMIRHGMSTKQMSEMLKIAVRTVETHRKNIRRKLAVTNESVSLSVFLRDL
ncbi:MAG: MEDS domain-containing protein [Kiritimatiellae bacterium]|nr:MEDS domain-containing protein [Kiritimatiellia bacterium]